MSHCIKRLSSGTILFIALFFYGLALKAQDLGTINFKVKGAAVAMPYFEKGLLLLHHFRYEEAAKEFQMAQLLDPELIMAYWGEAKCYDLAIWYHQDGEKARGVLYKLGVRKEERLKRAEVEIERDFLNSLEVLFAEEGTFKERQLNYNQALSEMYKKYPAEHEVLAFYALSSLTISPWQNDDAVVDTALDILEYILEGNPDHPGALNYTIHGCAYPEKAYKARKAIVQYPKIGVAIPYCQHVPAHIYAVTGQWKEFVEANQKAWDMAEKEFKVKKRSVEERDYHSLWWLTYGLVQQGRYTLAAEKVKDMNLDAKYTQSVKMRYYLAMMKSAYLFESNLWDGSIGEMDVPSKGFNIDTKNLVFYLEGMKAINKDDLNRAGWYMMQMQDQRTVEKSKPSEGIEFPYCEGHASFALVFPHRKLEYAEIMELQLKALKALKELNEKEVRDLMEQAIVLESQMRIPAGPPLIGKPCGELYGEMLLEFKHPEEALTNFDQTLKLYPNRTQSLVGKYRAYKILQDVDNAAAYKKMVLQNFENADPEVISAFEEL